MTKLIIKTDDGISVLYLEYEKSICNYYGFKVCDGKIMPLPKDTIKILDIFKLSLNRKPLGIEEEYDVFLDCDTNFKHYFKNNNEDFDKFILMNSEDLTVYKGDKNNKGNKGDFRKFSLVLSKFSKSITIGAAVGMIIGVCIEPWIMTISKYNELDQYKTDMKATSYLAYDSEDVIINYIMKSSNLNEKEKELLINDDFLNFIVPYLNEEHFAVYLDDRLNELDIVGYTAESEPEHANDGGYFQGDNILHIKDYNEENPEEHIREIGHEFVHLFQNPLCGNYIEEAMAAILNYEFYTKLDNSYKDEAINIKGLMEIIGPETLWEYTISGDLTEIKNLVKDYLEKDDFNEFVRIISSYIHDKSKKDKFKDDKMLLALIYRMYENKYGEIDHDFISLTRNTTTVRYYFNPKYINEDNSYYIEREKKDGPTDLKTAYDLGILKCYYTKEVSLEDYNALSEEEKENLILERPIYAWNDNISYDNKVISYDMVSFHDETKGTVYARIEDALESNLITISGYEIRYEVSYEESLNPEIKDACQYWCSTGYIEGNMIYDYELRIKHFVEPIDKKFPKEGQKIKF